MKVLVTGACGFIGSHMVEVLAAAGHEVVAGDLPPALDAPPEDRTRWPEVARAAGARLMPLDVTDPGMVKEAVTGAELVFHVAAIFDYMAPESALRAVNVEGTRNLFEALVADGSCRRVVNWGAGGIYGLPRPGVLPFREDGPKLPGNPYLRSKWDQERLAHSFAARGIEITSVRPTSPYGPRAAYGSGQLLLGLAAQRRPPAFRNVRTNVPFGHVVDLCRAALFLAELPRAAGEAYNVTDAGRLTAIDVARIVADEIGTKPMVLPPVPLRAMRKVLTGAAVASAAIARRRGTRPLLERDQMEYFGRDFLYSIEKLEETGFEMEWPKPEPGLRETLRWYLDNGWIERKRTARRTEGGNIGRGW